MQHTCERKVRKNLRNKRDGDKTDISSLDSNDFLFIFAVRRIQTRLISSNIFSTNREKNLGSLTEEGIPAKNGKPRNSAPALKEMLLLENTRLNL